MKERAATALPLGARCRQDEQQLQEQANQLAECQALLEAQREEMPRLTDTLAILKGQQRRPTIQPSRLEPGTTGTAPAEREPGREQKRAGSEKRAKTPQLKIDTTAFRRAERVPAGAVVTGYQDYVIHELEVAVSTTRYRGERWQTPSGG